jgi:hypothetical protein
MMIRICRPCIWRQEYPAMNILTNGVLMITTCFQYEASDQLQRIGPQRVQLLCCMRFHSKAWSTCTGDDKKTKFLLVLLVLLLLQSITWDIHEVLSCSKDSSYCQLIRELQLEAHDQLVIMSSMKSFQNILGH